MPNRKAIIFFKAGGTIMYTAEHNIPRCSKMALETNCVIFNVDFRNAPEAKAPKGILECYGATKHILENAFKYGVNPEKICIFGEDGGGNMCVGTCMHLAKNNESHLIRLALVDMPMCAAGWLTEPDSAFSSDV